jgi:hypothetical protein
VEPEQPNYPTQPTPTITTIKGVKTVNKDTTILTWKTLNVRVKNHGSCRPIKNSTIIK